MASLLAALAAVLLAVGPARAGAVYVNGVPADTLRNFQFSQVNVQIDTAGNIWIEAPQYRVVPQGPQNTVPVPSPATGMGPRTAPPVVQPTPALPAQEIPDGRYWLVSEDLKSVGHTVDVLVNGVKVQTIRSGAEQVILDIGQYLRRGTNSIVMNAQPASRLDGGKLFVYVSPGSMVQGTVEIGSPEITYDRSSASPVGGDSKSYTLVAN